MDDELARRLAAAYLSRELGIGMDYTMKHYLKDQPTGAFWLELADWVSEAMAQNREAQMRTGRA